MTDVAAGIAAGLALGVIALGLGWLLSWAWGDGGDL